MMRSTDILMKLLRIALGNERDNTLESEIDLKKVIILSAQQGVNSIAVDGWQEIESQIQPEQIISRCSPDELGDLKRDWYSLNLNADQVYENYKKAIRELSQFYASHGIRMVVLKGIGLSRYYPIPSHRPCGDIDIFLLGEQSNDFSLRADKMVQDELKLKVTKSKSGHHSHFHYKKYLIENHYELSNTYFGSKTARYLETELKTLINQSRNATEEEGILYPNANFNAVFLMWHMSTHFCGEGISLRQLCDWMMFIEKEHRNIDWRKVNKIWEGAHLKNFADVVNGILIRKLDIDPTIFPAFKRDRDMEHRILKDMFYGDGRIKSGAANYAWYYKNRWKYKLCSSRSWVSHMMDSVKMHLFHSSDLTEFEV